jgi:hypothetical protein
MIWRHDEERTIFEMKRLFSLFCCVAGLVAPVAIGAAPPACDADNGGITW